MTASDATTASFPMEPANDGTELDKLDLLILNVLKNAPNGLTLQEATASVCELVARSNDPELQCLADADPEFRAWRKVASESLQ